MWVPIFVPAAPVPIQLLANAPGEAGEDDISSWSPSPTWEIQKKLLTLCLNWPNSCCCGHVGSKPADEHSGLS